MTLMTCCSCDKPPGPQTCLCCCCCCWSSGSLQVCNRAYRETRRGWVYFRRWFGAGHPVCSPTNFCKKRLFIHAVTCGYICPGFWDVCPQNVYNFERLKGQYIFSDIALHHKHTQSADVFMSCSCKSDDIMCSQWRIKTSNFINLLSLGLSVCSCKETAAPVDISWDAVHLSKNYDCFPRCWRHWAWRTASLVQICQVTSETGHFPSVSPHFFCSSSYYI